MTNIKYTLEAEIQTENNTLSVEVNNEKISVMDVDRICLMDIYKEDFKKVLDIIDHYKEITGEAHD